MQANYKVNETCILNNFTHIVVDNYKTLNEVSNYTVDAMFMDFGNMISKNTVAIFKIIPHEHRSI